MLCSLTQLLTLYAVWSVRLLTRCQMAHSVEKGNHPRAQIPSERGNVPVLQSDSQQTRLGGGSPLGWSLGGLAQLTERSMSAVGSILPGAWSFKPQASV